MASTIARQIDRGRRRVAPFLTLRSLIAICSAIALLPLLTVVQRSEAERADARPSASAVPSYKASVLSDDPSNYYRLDETGGTTAADSSGNGNNGTYSASGISYGVSGALAAGGDSDTAVSVSATANVTAALPSSLNDIWPVATLEGWVQTTTNSAETNLFGFTNGGSVNDDATAAWLQDSGGTPEFLLTNNSGGTNVQSTAFTLPDKYWDGSWHMFDVVYYGDDGNVEPLAVYWDGQFLGSPGASAFDGSWATFNGLTFGNVPGLASGVSENLDELAVYPTALSGSRIDAHFTAAQSSPPFSAPCPPKPTSLYASTVLTDTPSLYYRTDDAAYGRVAFDSSGNCTASSPTNATYSSAGISTDPHGALAQGGDNDGAIAVMTNLADLVAVHFEDIEVIDSPTDGIKFASIKGRPLGDATFDRIQIVNPGIGGAGCGIVQAKGAVGSATITNVTVVNPMTIGFQNNSSAFNLIRGAGNAGVENKDQSSTDLTAARHASVVP